MFSNFPGNPFKSVQKRLSRTFQRASDFIQTVGPSPVKSLRTAVLAGDEEKALEVYSNDKNGRSLEEDLHPSMPFPIKKYGDETPLHLAAKMAMSKLVDTFIVHGGCPSVLNAREESCLHCVCSRSDFACVRLDLVNTLLAWRGVEIDGQQDCVSLNRVDVDGNAAVHYAAKNGLDDCVQSLVEKGAIISLVNRAQQTCCDLADEAEFKQLANVLELALLYQPDDVSMVDFDDAHRRSHEANHVHPVLAMDSQSMKPADLGKYIDAVLSHVSQCLNNDGISEGKRSYDDKENEWGGIIDETRAEALLNAYAWDVQRLLKEWKNSPAAALKFAHLSLFPPFPMPFDSTVSSIITSPSNAVAIDAMEELDISSLNITPACSPERSIALATSVNIEKIEPESPVIEFAHTSSDTTGEKEDAFISSPFPLSPPDILPAILPAISSNDDTLPPVPPSSSLLQTTSQTLPLCPLTPPPPASNSMSSSNPPPVTDIVIVDNNEGPSCMVCGDNMLPPLPMSMMFSKKAPERERRTVTCTAGHSFCFSCWSTHLRLQVRDEGAHSLQCPAFKCGELLGADWAKPILGKKMSIRLKKQRLRHAVDCSPSLCWCTACDLVVEVKDSRSPFTTGLVSSSSSSSSSLITPTKSGFGGEGISRTVICANGHGFCLDCSNEAHSPCSCADWERWNKKVREEVGVAGAKSGDDIANALWVAANTKRCPRCTTPIEKDEGCNHMSCRKCRYEFCWICMQDWSLHSNATGGFFQCNRFNERVTDEEEIPLGRFLAEEGSAHHETARMMNRGQRMARFIHHYTRFQAHGDSAAMEAKMAKECSARIEASLAAAAKGEIKWLQSSVINPFTDSFLFIGESKEESKDGDEEDEDNENGTKTVTEDEDEEHKINDQSPLNTLTNKTVGNDDTKNEKCQTENGNSVNNNKPNPLDFLNDGFCELLKCRSILRGSFPFAFFAFGDDDDESSHRNSKRKHRVKHEYRRKAFEQHQSEMEFLTEMLSNVVARKRLRASCTQIIQTTRAARSKRIEMEESILNNILSEQMSTPDTHNSARSRISSSASARNSGGNRSNSALRHRASDGAGIWGTEGDYMADDLDEMDIVALLSELEHAHTLSQSQSQEHPRTAARLPSSSASSLPSSTPSSVSQQAQAQTMSGLNRSTPEVVIRTATSRGGTQSSSGNSSPRRFSSPRSTPSSPPQLRFGNSIAKSADEIDEDDGDESRQREGERERERNRESERESEREREREREIIREISGGWEDSHIVRLTARAAEEEALNRAILMSLQAFPTSVSIAADERQQQQQQQQDAVQPPEEDVESLMGMGFTREAVVTALLSNRNDVMRAADALLNGS